MSRARDVAGVFLWASAQPAVTWLASWLSSWRSQRFVFKRRGGGERAREAPGISPEAFRSGFAAASALLTVGLENSLVSVPGAHLLGAGGTPLPSCGNQRRLQTWPSVPSLTKLSQAESHCPRLYFPITTIKNYRKLSSLKKNTDFFSYGSGGLKFKGQGVGRALFLLEAPGKTRVLVVPGCRRLQRPESSGLPTWHLRTIPCGRGFRCHFSPLVPPAPCSLGPWRLP